jgi:hypothetical protein
MVIIAAVITFAMSITVPRWRYNHYATGRRYNHYRAMIAVSIMRASMIITAAVITNGYGFAVVWIVTAS